MQPRRTRTLGRQSGISLIEQIMVCAIAGMLGCIALPSLHGMLINHRIRAAQLDFAAGLRYARAVAAGENVRIVFCPTRDGRHCSNESQWDEGWLLGRDSDHDNQPDREPLYVGRRRAGQVMVRSSEGRRHVLFHPDGSTPGSNTPRKALNWNGFVGNGKPHASLVAGEVKSAHRVFSARLPESY